MAQNFYGNSIRILDDQRTEVYASDASTTSVLHSIFIANTDSLIDITIDIEIQNGGEYFYIARLCPLPRGGTLIFDKPINMMPNQSLHVTSSKVDGSVDVTVSTLQITP